MAMYIWVYFNTKLSQNFFFKIEKSKKKLSFLDIFTILPLKRPRVISQNVSGLYYARRCAGYKIHVFVQLYYLGRAKVFSRAATDFGPSTSLHVNNLASDTKANPRDLYGTLIVKRKTRKVSNL